MLREQLIDSPRTLHGVCPREYRLWAGDRLLGWVSDHSNADVCRPWRAYCVGYPPAVWFATEDDAVSHIDNGANRDAPL